MTAFLHAHPYVLKDIAYVSGALVLAIVAFLAGRALSPRVAGWRQGVRYSRTACKHLKAAPVPPQLAAGEDADDEWADTLHGMNADKDPVLCGDVRSAWIRDPARAVTAGRPPWETAPQRAVQTVNLPPWEQVAVPVPWQIEAAKLVSAAVSDLPGPYAPGAEARTSFPEARAGEPSPTVVNVTVNIAVIHQPGTDLAEWMLDLRSQFDRERALLATWARELTGSAV